MGSIRLFSVIDGFDAALYRGLNKLDGNTHHAIELIKERYADRHCRVATIYSPQQRLQSVIPSAAEGSRPVFGAHGRTSIPSTERNGT